MRSSTRLLLRLPLKMRTSAAETELLSFDGEHGQSSRPFLNRVEFSGTDCGDGSGTGFGFQDVICPKSSRSCCCTDLGIVRVFASDARTVKEREGTSENISSKATAIKRVVAAIGTLTEACDCRSVRMQELPRHFW